MKPIVYLLNSFPNISETFIIDEILTLMEQGVPIRIFSLKKPATSIIHKNAKKILSTGAVTYLNNPGRLELTKALLKLALFKPHKIIPFIKLDLPRWMKLEALNFSDIIIDCNPAHIHCHYAAQSAQIALTINLINSTPYSITTHGYDVFIEQPDNYLVLTNRSSIIFTISDFNKKYLIENLTLPEKKIRTCYCGVDISAFAELKLKPIAIDQEINILTVARLHPIKGHAFLLKAIHKLQLESNYRFKLWFAGDGPLKSELEELTKLLGLGSIVRFLGQQTQCEIVQLIKECHLFVLPSLSEGIPVSLMEAMAGFTPVIGPDINGVPELITDGVNGFLFEPGDVDSLCKSIASSIDKRELHQQITQNAYDKVRLQHSLKTNAVAKYKYMTNQII
ncbi:MAG: glycosyltransferase family 4 protein [Sedimenticola sp.]|nr:glycosyltransferase family 4 protein [Sedimenticola sp.]